LDIKPLNITKYLNYLAFKEAIILYFNKVKNLSIPLDCIDPKERSTQGTNFITIKKNQRFKRFYEYKEKKL
jgi:hypothetical protein